MTGITTLYLDKESIGEKRLIYSVDIEFDAVIYNLQLNDKDKEYMKKIDKAAYKGNGRIKTPFGVTEIQNLSTGCKALILLNHQHDLGNAA